MEPDLKAVAAAGFADVHLPLIHHQPRGRMTHAGGAALIAFDLPRWGLNTLFAVSPLIETPEVVLAAADRYFAGCTEPYHVTLDPEVVPELERELGSCGWTVQDDMTVMVLPEIPAAPPAPPPGLTICRVVNDTGLRDYLAPKDPDRPPSPWDGIDEAINPSVAVAHDPDIALFAGYVDGRPVATSAMYRVGAFVDIGAVGTATAYRGRGIGTAITWAAVHEGRARGCTSAGLGATAMGYPIYLLMGFVPVATYRRYTPPPPINRPPRTFA